MTPAQWIDAIRADGAAIVATSPEHLGLDVPSCPDWTVRDLLSHLGAVHRWATRFLTLGPDSRERFGFDTSDVPDGAGIVDWYAQRLHGLVEQLEATDPASAVRSFTGAVTASFWFRRQAHETSIHRWDLQNATPVGASEIDAVLAADGVDEWREVFVPRFLGRGDGLPEAVTGAVIGLRADGRQWRWQLDRQGISVVPDAEPAVTVTGSSSELMLALWRRIPLSQLTVEGDAAAVEALLDAVRVT